ncbi:DarT ssDNA thymidine ADP-ribosyltransferase family protein [Pseudomonas sp. Pseusp3]|uniref:DarT ssDNA thymidine ADP-ribosyltransferase family protein n=1 Tax=Pseudomonas sp. Pseusp3 TaxID=3243029 RepID=UPI0039AEFD5B
MPQKIATDRNIQYLFHFTRSSNLPSILTSGIIPRKLLQNNNIPFTLNDAERFDKREDRTCLSISFPNCKMLCQMMANFPNDDWAVIRLKPDTLWQNDCLFTETNAAKAYIRDSTDASLRGGVALEKLFANEELRKQNGRQKHETTDVQAEVLVSGIIPVSEIIDLNFHYEKRLIDFKGLTALSEQFNTFTWQFNPDYFYQRKDNG